MKIPTDIEISFSDVCAGSKVFDCINAGVPDSVTVFSPWKIDKTHLYFRCVGYVPLSSLCNQLVGCSRNMPFVRHNYVVNEFAAAVWRLRSIGQSSYAAYSRVRYDPSSKRYLVCSFFKLDVKR